MRSCGTWLSVESLDGFLARMARDLQAANAGGKGVHRFVVVNDEQSEDGGNHWFTVVYEIRRDG